MRAFSKSGQTRWLLLYYQKKIKNGASPVPND
jgi:hypothetical protein